MYARPPDTMEDRQRFKIMKDKEPNRYRTEYTMPYADYFESQIYNKLKRNYGTEYIIVWRGDVKYAIPGMFGEGSDTDRMAQIVYGGGNKKLTEPVNKIFDVENYNDIKNGYISTWYYPKATIDYEMYYCPDIASKANNHTLTADDVSNLKTLKGDAINVLKPNGDVDYDLLRVWIRENTTEPAVFLETKRRMDENLNPISISEYDTQDFNEGKISGFRNLCSFVPNGCIAYAILIMGDSLWITELNPEKGYYIGDLVKKTFRSGVSKEEKQRYNFNPDSAPSSLTEDTVNLKSLGFKRFSGTIPDEGETGHLIAEAIEKKADINVMRKAFNTMKQDVILRRPNNVASSLFPEIPEDTDENYILWR